MKITTPPELLKSIPCAECGTVFQQHSTNQKCCSVRCRDKGERRRARERQGAAPMAQVPRKDLLATLHSPLAAVLDSYAVAVAALKGEKALVITGALPDGWAAPTDTEIVPQSDGSFVLGYAQKFDLDAMLKSGNVTIK